MQKRAILAEADEPGPTASAVARRHGLHSSLLFRWRRAVLPGSAPRPCPPGRPSYRWRCPPSGAPVVPTEPASIEIELAGGHRVRVPAGVDLALLRGMLAALPGR